MVPLAGCVGAKFQSDFSTMAVQAPQPAYPLVGTWEGSWQSSAQPGTHAARAVVSVNPRGTYVVQLEMAACEPEPGVSILPFHKYWIELHDISAATTSDSASHFNTKTRIKKANRSNLVAEAMTLQGTVQRDSLQIQFSTNDALDELDHGRIELHRVDARGASSLPP
jgi:hypothetical protein